MADPFVAEIRVFPFNFPPKGWAFCNGQILPLSQNTALFSLLGTTYGGNGQTTFGLPDMRGRVSMHIGNGHTQGEAGGEENHTLTQSEMPAHIHFMQGNSGEADTSGAAVPPTNNSFAQAFAVQAGGVKAVVNRFGTGAPDGALLPAAIGNAGGSQAHSNQQPYNTLNFCIALQGVFPSRN